MSGALSTCLSSWALVFPSEEWNAEGGRHAHSKLPHLTHSSSGGQPGFSLEQRLFRAVPGVHSPPSPGGWMLKMPRAQERDRGFYSCLASNEAGEVQRNFSVEVLGTPQPVPMSTPRIPPLLSWSFWGLSPGLRAHALGGTQHRKGGKTKPYFVCLISGLCSEVAMELSGNSRD